MVEVESRGSTAGWIPFTIDPLESTIIAALSLTHTHTHNFRKERDKYGYLSNDLFPKIMEDINKLSFDYHLSSSVGIMRSWNKRKKQMCLL